MIKRNCKICGKEFYITPSLIKKGWGKFCSYKCMGINRTRTLTKENNPNWKNGGIKIRRNCLVCGKDFFVSPYRIKKGKGKYCSQRCARIYRNKNETKRREDYPSWKGGLIKKICITCGKEFSIQPCRDKKGEGKYCSLKCMGIFNMKNCREKSPNWKGGITSYYIRIRGSNKYAEWRQKVLLHDDFTCQKCGQRGGILHAHHKKSFNKLLEEIKKYLPLFDLYQGAMLYTPLWDMNNGETLCEKCHNKKRPKANNKGN